MLLMSVGGALITLFLPHAGSALAGTLASYLTLTSWMTVRQKHAVGYSDLFALLIALCVVATGVDMGLTGTGPGALSAFALAGIAVIAAAGDLRLLIRGSIHGKPRLTRHLWRLGAALLIATGSFATISGSAVVVALEMAMLTSLIFWIIHLQACVSTR